MNVQIASLCDYAAEYNGKLCLMGTFDSLYAREFPVTQACYLAARLCFEPEDEGELPLSITLTDADGENVFDPIESKVKVNIPDGLPFLTRNLTLNLAGLTFQKSGKYALSIESGDQILVNLPLLAIQVKDPESNDAGEAGEGSDSD